MLQSAEFVVSRLVTVAIAAALSAPLAVGSEPRESLQWHHVSAGEVAGKGWHDTEFPFDRLPARAKSIVRPEVWALARHSAGLYVDFKTNASAISARWTLTIGRLAMPHMPATGVSGLDLYVLHGKNWHFLANGRPTESPTNTTQLVKGLKPEATTTYRLYFPLYNGVSSLEIGVPQDATFEIISPKPKLRPIVIYGTSITQGGCASRPGMSYPAIVGRRLDTPVVNLGFSGNGKAEPEVASLISELSASVIVLDPLPNLFPDQVAERLPKFVEILRERHPDTPIVLMASPLFPATRFLEESDQRVAASNQHLRRVYEARIEAGDHYISLVPPCDFTSDGGEPTVDGIHPTDLGFVRLADAVEKAIRAATETTHD